MSVVPLKALLTVRVVPATCTPCVPATCTPCVPARWWQATVKAEYSELRRSVHELRMGSDAASDGPTSPFDGEAGSASASSADGVTPTVRPSPLPRMLVTHVSLRV